MKDDHAEFSDYALNDVDDSSLESSDMDDITAIAVMGVTGSGKSNFIKHATSSERIKVGHDMQSCE